jgi:WD40 repeat protein
MFGASERTFTVTASAAGQLDGSGVRQHQPALLRPGNSTFVTGSDGTITRWNSSTGEIIASLAAPTDLVEATIDTVDRVQRRCNKLAVTYSGESFYDVTVVWNVASGSRLIHVTDLYQPTFSPDGTRLAGVSDAANRINTYAV